MLELDKVFSEPTETMDLELKRWIDPRSEEGIQKIVRACFAMRNNNGGTLVIGLKNDGSLDVEGRPANPKLSFQQDEIQKLIGKYASEPFEVRVEVAERNEDICVVLRVPSGVRTPVACKSDLGTKLKSGDVYVRTLQANRTVSSCAATWQDWPRIVQLCFDNREADIGAFVRRHLSGIGDGPLSKLIESFGSLRKPSAVDVARELLEEGHRRFAQILEERVTKPDTRLGTHEVAVVAEGDQSEVPPLSEETLWRLTASMPNHTGFPPWTMLLGALNSDLHPYVYHNGWEAFIENLHDRPHLDFWRLEPTGRFYIARGLEDDLSTNQRAPQPYTILDFVLLVSRTTEVLSVAIALSETLGFKADSTLLSFEFRWRQLRGRRLGSWVEPLRSLYSRNPARQDEVVSRVSVPLDTPRDALTPHVEKAVRPVLEIFGGPSLDRLVIDGIVKRVLSRQ